MAHLIGPLRDLELTECIARLAAAHDYLQQAAQRFLSAAVSIPPEYWGSDFKRLRVPLPSPRPVIIEQESHNFIEVVNQVAGLERLLDGLRWFAEVHPAAHVTCCHPSTSSLPGENDVILTDSLDSFRVEVFDIAGTTITNDKLRKTLTTFGLGGAWASGRLLIFVSESIAARILPRGPHVGPYHFNVMYAGPRTHVFELLHL